MWRQIISPTIIHQDNKGSIALAENPTAHSRTKHIDIRYHFVRQVNQRGEVKFVWLPTNSQVADILTKALKGANFQRNAAVLVNVIGLLF